MRVSPFQNDILVFELQCKHRPRALRVSNMAYVLRRINRVPITLREMDAWVRSAPRILLRDEQRVAENIGELLAVTSHALQVDLRSDGK